MCECEDDLNGRKAPSEPAGEDHYHKHDDPAEQPERTASDAAEEEAMAAQSAHEQRKSLNERPKECAKTSECVNEEWREERQRRVRQVMRDSYTQVC
jgi:hypothetical protein